MFEELGEGPHYAPPNADVLFGDIFEAPFLLDLFGRSNTTLMGGGKLLANLVPKLGKWMGETLGQDDIDLYSPSFTPKPDTRVALAHASFLPADQTRRAIVVSDSCLIATALVQGRQKRSVGGRLQFAPLSSVSNDKWNALVEAEDFERFPLPPGERIPEGTVAELSSCFMVDARDVKKHADARLVSLTSPLAEELEVHWNGYATRRGPRAYSRNTLKLAALLAGGAQPGPEEEDAADAIAVALDLAFVIEARDLEDVSEAEEAVRLASGDAGTLTPPLIGQLVEHLRELSTLAAAAAERLAGR